MYSIHSKNKGTTAGVLWRCKVPLGAILVPLGYIAKSHNQRVHEIATGLML
jgi:hypothetical protein